MITIRKYQAADEAEWVRCRVLSLLDTPYYDNVLTQKEKFGNPAVEIVADYGGKIVGVLDVEYDTPENPICYRNNTPGGIIRNLAVLPEYRDKLVASHLLKYACSLLGEAGIVHLESWVREEERAQSWFLNRGFFTNYSYLHFYANGQECKNFGEFRMLDCFVMKLYGEYTGSNPDAIRKSAGRSYNCYLYEQDIPVLEKRLCC